MLEKPTLDLLIATTNQGKVIEVRHALNDLPLTLHSLEEYSGLLLPDESGGSYEENAIIKARSYANQTGLWALADDSGLEVNALGGAPGLRSARFGGEGTSDINRIELLLEKLCEVETADRRARFICAAAIVALSGELIHTAMGTCNGRIAMTPAGNLGFGYDPVFIPDGFEMTFGEIASSVKERISHRAKALGATRDFIEQLLDGSLTRGLAGS